MSHDCPFNQSPDLTNFNVVGQKLTFFNVKLKNGNMFKLLYFLNQVYYGMYIEAIEWQKILVSEENWMGVSQDCR